MNKSIAILLAFVLVGCQQADESTEVAEPKLVVEEGLDATEETELSRLEMVLDSQPQEVKDRYKYRHPRETLEFFGIEPGMTVVEGLPGRGWYTKLLLPYLGAEGHLVGASYALDMWPNFSFANEEFLKTQSTWVTDWPADAAEWRDEDSASVAAFNFGAMPQSLAGTADAVFLVRALHNTARFESVRGYLAELLADSHTALKPGGVLGVVQHHARDEMSDEFADGSHGYLKKDFVIAAAEQAGFEFVAESDVNANAADQPSEDDIVWRLPPSLRTSRDNPDLKAQLEAVGESNRMTLKFRKPE